MVRITNAHLIVSGIILMICAYAVNVRISEGAGIVLSLASGICFLTAIINKWEDIRDGK